MSRYSNRERYFTGHGSVRGAAVWAYIPIKLSIPKHILQLALSVPFHPGTLNHALDSKQIKIAPCALSGSTGRLKKTEWDWIQVRQQRSIFASNPLNHLQVSHTRSTSESPKSILARNSQCLSYFCVFGHSKREGLLRISISQALLWYRGL